MKEIEMLLQSAREHREHGKWKLSDMRENPRDGSGEVERLDDTCFTLSAAKFLEAAAHLEAAAAALEIAHALNALTE